MDRLCLWLQKVWNRTKPRAVILLYHRVAELHSDPQLLSVTPKNFAEQLDCLHRDYYPIHLKTLKKCILGKRLHPKSVVITFDDGYRDNLNNARPLLDSFDIPATVFVTSGKINSQTEFWWDELERILLLPEILPDILELTIQGRTYTWNLAQEDEQGKGSMDWNVLMEKEITLRQKAYCDLTGKLRILRDDEREDILTRMRRWSEIEGLGRSDYLPLSVDELQCLANGNLVEIGSHGITHSVLSIQECETQRLEIIKSKQRLESILERPIIAFSYPFGGKRDYSEKTIHILRESGYQYACANFPDRVLPKTDIFRLPRFIVRDWGGDEFIKMINRFFFH